jgi:hypothetical protein
MRRRTIARAKCTAPARCAANFGRRAAIKRASRTAEPGGYSRSTTGGCAPCGPFAEPDHCQGRSSHGAHATKGVFAFRVHSESRHSRSGER